MARHLFDWCSGYSMHCTSHLLLSLMLFQRKCKAVRGYTHLLEESLSFNKRELRLSSPVTRRQRETSPQIASSVILKLFWHLA